MVRQVRVLWDDPHVQDDLRLRDRDLIAPAEDSPRDERDFARWSRTDARRTAPQRRVSSGARKQISLFVPLSDWKTIRQEAARRGVPMTELCRQWLNSGLAGLRRRLDDPMTADGK
jgi:hypothetical protein